MSGVLAGRVAIVAGGASRIGLAIAKGLAGEGVRIVLADSGAGPEGDDTNPAAAGAAAAQLPGCAVYAGELTTEAAARTIVGFAVERFGRLDILVNVSPSEGFATRRSRADVERMHEADRVAAVALTNAVAAWMRETAKRADGARAKGNPERRPFGAIVNVSSIADSPAVPEAIAHESKAGWVGLTRAMAKELARTGATCNAVTLIAAVSMAQPSVAADDPPALGDARGLGIAAEHVANLIIWLASPSGAATTGQVFGVHGRELFLFGRGRPVARINMPAGNFFARAFGETLDLLLRPLYTTLDTDIEALDAETAL